MEAAQKPHQSKDLNLKKELSKFLKTSRQTKIQKIDPIVYNLLNGMPSFLRKVNVQSLLLSKHGIFYDFKHVDLLS